MAREVALLLSLKEEASLTLSSSLARATRGGRREGRPTVLQSTRD